MVYKPTNSWGAPPCMIVIAHTVGPPMVAVAGGQICPKHPYQVQ